jgi:hypothetical protein
MPTRRITKKDGSWFQVDGDDVTDGDHSIDVKFKDWTGTTHRHHINKTDIVDDREWSVNPLAVAAVVILFLLLASQC